MAVGLCSTKNLNQKIYLLSKNNNYTTENGKKEMYQHEKYMENFHNVHFGLCKAVHILTVSFRSHSLQTY